LWNKQFYSNYIITDKLLKDMLKNFIVCICAVALSTTVKAEPTETWQILFNNKVIFKGNSDQTDPSASLKVSSFKATDKITIKYFMSNADNTWKRTFLINDESEKNFVTLGLNKQTGSASFNAAKLKELVEKKKPFYIYTVSVPKNPSLAATVRVRRVLLCKVEWNNL
jgi:hypothetical protein